MLKQTKRNLPKLTTVCSFLDSHAYPPGAATDHGTPASLETRMNEAQAAVQRSSLYNALLDSRVLVVNRTYFFSQNVLSDMIISNTNERYEIVNALRSQVIRPFLMGESTLADGPGVEAVNPERFSAWQKVIDETGDDIAAVKLSWTSNRNGELGSRFETFCRGLNAIDPERNCRDLNLPLELCPDIEKIAKDVSELEKSEKKAWLGREEVYAHLLNVKLTGNEDPFRANLIGKLSPAREAIRQLVDIRYATNLSDLLDRFSFRGVGTASRSVLQCDGELSRGAGKFTIDEISTINENFEKANNEFSSMNIGSINSNALEIGDIIYIRGQKVWRDYISILEKCSSGDMKIGESHPLLDESIVRERVRTRFALQRLVAEKNERALQRNRRESVALAVDGVGWAIGFIPVIGPIVTGAMLHPSLKDRIVNYSTALANVVVRSFRPDQDQTPLASSVVPAFRWHLTNREQGSLIDDADYILRHGKIALAEADSNAVANQAGLEHKDADQ